MKERSKTTHISLLMLDANNDNSWATTKSSSIKSCKLDEIPDFLFKFQAHSDCCIQSIKK